MPPAFLPVLPASYWRTWLWNFGSGKPRLGGLNVKETAMLKETVRKDQAKRSAETRRHRRADRAWSTGNEVCCLVYVCTSMYLYVPVCTGMYHELTKLEQFWNSTLSYCIPCIMIGAVQALSYLSWLFLDESENNLSSWVYALVCTGTYQYVRPWDSRTALYRVVPVRTSTYPSANRVTIMTPLWHFE